MTSGLWPGSFRLAPLAYQRFWFQSSEQQGRASFHSSWGKFEALASILKGLDPITGPSAPAFLKASFLSMVCVGAV
jgi:hypothetical protein